MIVLTDNEVIEQLIGIYFEHENYCSKNLDAQEIKEYFTDRLLNRNILFEDHSGEIIAYIEFWRVNMDQVIRLVLNKPFDPWQENLTDGNICYLANGWRKQGRQTKDFFRNFIKGLLFWNLNCLYFVEKKSRKLASGRNHRKNIQISIFKRSCLEKRVKGE